MFDGVYFTVYQITNTINGKIYVGAHVTDDLQDGYIGSGTLLQRAVTKYGIDSFIKEYLAVFNNKDDMYAYEAAIVNSDFLQRSDVYNLKEGGLGGWDLVNKNLDYYFSQDQKTRRAQIGRYYANLNGANIKGSKKHAYLYSNDYEYRNMWYKNFREGIKHSPGFKGKRHSDTTRQIIGEKNKISQKGKKNSQYGTMWIFHPETNTSKKIPKEDFKRWELEGWQKGRKLQN